jgi:hypothetical protein
MTTTTTTVVQNATPGFLRSVIAGSDIATKVAVPSKMFDDRCQDSAHDDRHHGEHDGPSLAAVDDPDRQPSAERSEAY